MTFAQFLSILRARKWAALITFGVIVALTVILSLVLPAQYTGSASVVIDVRPDPVSLMTNLAATQPSFMSTQLDIVTSDRVALKVIRDLKLADSPGIRQQWRDETDGQGTIEQWLITVLQKKLDVKPSRDSNVITINYKAPDPRFAAALANAFAQAYIQTTLELRADPAQNFRKLFDVQTKDAREALERAQTKLSEYQRRKGIIASDERFDVENGRLNDLSTQLTQLQAISAESASRQTQAQGAQADRLQDVLNNPVIGALKTDLSRNEAKLQELSQRLGDANPQVVEAKANIAELRVRIDAETRKVTGGVAVTNTINKSREQQIRRDLEAQRAKVLQMKLVRDDGVVLQREVDTAQRIYDNIAGRLNQAMLESQNNQSYANMLTMALPPVDPSFPKLWLNIALAVFLGILLAIGVALLREMLDRRIRTPEDAVAALGLPVLGSLPTPKAKRFNPSRPAMLFLNRPLSLPAPRAAGEA